MAKAKLVASLLVLSVCVAGPINSKGEGEIGKSRKADPGTQNQVTITSDHQKVTHECKGRGFAIIGNSNEITLTGECGGIVVSGDDNKIDVEAVEAINTSGDRNRVVWGRGRNGKKPEISNTGTQNEISQKKK
jgi:DUF3060 family protein